MELSLFQNERNGFWSMRAKHFSSLWSTKKPTWKGFPFMWGKPSDNVIVRIKFAYLKHKHTISHKFLVIQDILTIVRETIFKWLFDSSYSKCHIGLHKRSKYKIVLKLLEDKICQLFSHTKIKSRSAKMTRSEYSNLLKSVVLTHIPEPKVWMGHGEHATILPKWY